MSFLLDTCVISEAAKEPGDPAVDRWLKSTAPDAFRISVISFGEMKYGVERLPVGAKRRHSFGRHGPI